MKGSIPEASSSADAVQAGGLNSLTVPAVLRRAADLIEPEGRWIQGALAGDRQGRRLEGALTGADYCASCWCVYGAIQKAGWNAARDSERRERAAHPERYVFIKSFHREEPVAAEFVCRVVGVPTPAALAEWNDAKGRTQAEVVAALRAAALLADGAGNGTASTTDAGPVPGITK